MRKKIPNGYVLWKGASELDKKPIVLIVTGVKSASTNPKTGWMLQTWIMRSDMHPMAALHTNKDLSVCDSCPLRGDKGKQRACYVNMATIGQIYNAYTRGLYPQLEDTSLLQSRPLRLGAYGDPAAVPFAVWKPILLAVDPTLHFSKTRSPLLEGTVRTGYTHLWRRPKSKAFQRVCMASVESPEARADAKEQGWRTYRIKHETDLVLPGEVVCPASKEADNFAMTCTQCGLCGGTSVAGPDVVINVHGVRAQLF